jgi:hypothetical protein
MSLTKKFINRETYGIEDIFTAAYRPNRIRACKIDDPSSLVAQHARADAQKSFSMWR